MTIRHSIDPVRKDRDRRVLPLAALVSALILCCGCTADNSERAPRYGASPAATKGAVYSFAVHPLHNPAKLLQAYQPLVDYLNAEVGNARFILEASRDYAAYEEKFRGGKPDVLLPNPWQTLQALKTGYRVIAMAGEPKDFKGIVVARKDSGLRRPADLKGKAISYPSRTALAACIMPQYYLHRRGIDVNRDIDNQYVGSQESAIMNAYLGKTAAAATWPPPWRAFLKDHPKEGAMLEIVWETESLINNSVMVKATLPPELQERVRALLTGLHKTEKGRAILAGMETGRFLPASDSDYSVVRDYVERFEREVRPVEKQ
jgi:phosphonate transport system substrate-binding protein